MDLKRERLRPRIFTTFQELLPIVMQIVYKQTPFFAE